MEQSNKQLLTTLIASVQSVEQRILKLEESMNLGRGGFKALLIVFGLIGTILGAVKMFGGGK